MIYENLSKHAKYSTNVSFDVSYIKGVKLTISGPSFKKYKAKFIDHKTNKVHYEAEITGGMWSKPSIEYYIKWRIEIYELPSGEKVYEEIFNAKDQRVYIHIGSKAIGDTLAWFPYVLEFQKSHNCKLICSTFHNEWFKSLYPEIEFSNPGIPVKNLYAMYEVGWFYADDGNVDESRNPSDPKKFPLQQTSSDILGLPFKEIKPKISIDCKIKDSLYKEDYVVIAPHASKHAAYWNHQGGWQQVIDFLNKNNYKVVMSSQEPLGDEWHDSKLGGKLHGVIDKTNKSFDETLNLIKNAKALVSVSSGLSWVSWALNIPTILISGFSEPMLEMSSCYRVYTPEGFCRGCQTTDKLDAGDWEWCPFHKNTDRHFECTKSITPNMVTSNLKKALNIY